MIEMSLNDFSLDAYPGGLFACELNLNDLVVFTTKLQENLFCVSEALSERFLQGLREDVGCSVLWRVYDVTPDEDGWLAMPKHVGVKGELFVLFIVFVCLFICLFVCAC